jgi:hypothetical protein
MIRGWAGDELPALICYSRLVEKQYFCLLVPHVERLTSKASNSRVSSYEMSDCTEIRRHALTELFRQVSSFRSQISLTTEPFYVRLVLDGISVQSCAT